jgi:hypothetical protein
LEGAVASVGFFHGSVKPTEVFVELYQHESPLLFVHVCSHEVLRQDQDVSRKEVVNSSLDAVVHGQILLGIPAFARSGTELARRFNTQLMARPNNRDATGNLRLLAAQGGIFPGGLCFPYFAGSEPLGGDTPGNSALRAERRAVTKVDVASPDFDDSTVALLDGCRRLLRPSQVLALARVLKLDARAQAALAVASQ